MWNRRLRRAAEQDLDLRVGHTLDGLTGLGAHERGDVPFAGVLGTPYESELHFTRAAALAAVERFDDAMTEAHAGLEKAVRPSSTRNGWFLLGSIAADAGRCERALEYFDRGLDLRYRGQGGFAPLRRAGVIAQLGRGDVLDALSLVIERDPQSQAARDASRELETRSKSDPSGGN